MDWHTIGHALITSALVVIAYLLGRHKGQGEVARYVLDTIDEALDEEKPLED